MIDKKKLQLIVFSIKKARSNIRELLTTKTQDFFGASECTVRVNSIQSGLCHDDLDEILATPTVKKFVEPFLLLIPWVF